MFMTALITVIAAYFLGSINFAVIFTKIFKSKDIRNIGSGNAGATNVLRTSGAALGSLTFFCDALKGFLSAGLGYLIFKYIFTVTSGANLLYTPILGAFICGFSCMIGHIYPLFFSFKGGKGVATGFGILLFCSPYSALVGILVFVLVLIFSKYVSLSSLLGTLATVISVGIFGIINDSILLAPQIIIAVIMGAIVFLKHISNIRRLISGEENKLGNK